MKHSLDNDEEKDCKERVCCDEESSFKVTYDGGSMGNDIILVCNLHILRHPYDKRIISKEKIENGK